MAKGAQAPLWPLIFDPWPQVLNVTCLTKHTRSRHLHGVLPMQSFYSLYVCSHRISNAALLLDCLTDTTIILNSTQILSCQVSQLKSWSDTIYSSLECREYHSTANVLWTLGCLCELNCRGFAYVALQFIAFVYAWHSAYNYTFYMWCMRTCGRGVKIYTT